MLVKVFLAVFICKILYFIGTKIGRGSSLPGKITLKIFPDILRCLKLPETIIAVTGSNGKTTTTELIVHALKANGANVSWNREGSNQTEGIATLLLRVSSLTGNVLCDAIVMECDERYAKKIFEMVKPTILLVTNLCRDQLTRNGHQEFIEDCLRSAISAAGNDVHLILNTDDPYVAALITQGDTSIVSRFGIDIGQSGQGDGNFWALTQPKGVGGVTKNTHTGMYDDGAFCPVCKARMTYSYRITGHYGNYKCTVCSFKRHDPDFSLTDGMLKLKFPSITNLYNFCAAVAVAEAAGIRTDESVRVLDDYQLKSGRVLSLSIGDREGFLLLSKHENSFAYDTSLNWIIEQKKPCTVIILVDSISRKYYTSETSWLWDINFDLLADENVKNVVLAGRYINELAARFALSKVDREKIGYIADLSGLYENVKDNTTGDIYALTCFADKLKLLKAFNV